MHLVSAGASGERRFWGLALVILFCMVNPAQLRGTPSVTEQAERMAASKLGANDIIYSDGRSASSLVYFRRHMLAPADETTIAFENVPAGAMKRGAYVLVDREMIQFLVRSYKYKPPAYVDAPPATWRTIWSHGNATLYLIGESENIDSRTP
jgi:hypothetical protein